MKNFYIAPGLVQAWMKLAKKLWICKYEFTYQIQTIDTNLLFLISNLAMFWQTEHLISQGIKPDNNG